MSEGIPTPEEVAIDQTRQDFSDILALLDQPAWSRWFVRRLKEEKAKVEKQFRYDPPSKCDAAERETLRRILNVYDHFLALPETDKAACEQTMKNYEAEQIAKTYQPQYPEGARPEPGMGAMG
jgi:hypothetical protein